MQFDTLLFEQRGGLAQVTLNRPQKLNALSMDMVDELRAAAAAIDAQPTIRAVLLSAAGRAFCAGADLTRSDLFQSNDRSMGQNIGHGLTQQFNPMVRAWCDLRVPVVVAVNGVAAGAGVSLALVGDLVIAARSASFLQLFAPKLGLIPDLGSTFHLPRLIGTARAKGMALLGEALSAADAERWGLIWSCVDDDKLQESAAALTARLADGPTQAFSRIKHLFNEPPTATLGEQLALEAIAQTQLGDSPDFAEGLLAFREKRAAKFSGGYGAHACGRARGQRRLPIFASGTRTSSPAVCVVVGAGPEPQLSQPPQAPPDLSCALAVSRWARPRPHTAAIAVKMRVPSDLGPSA